MIISHLNTRQALVVLGLLVILFSIPILALFLDTSPNTPAWSSYYVSGAMYLRGQRAQLYDAEQQQRIWQSLGMQNKETLPYISPPYLALVSSRFAIPTFSQSTILWALLNFILIVFILNQINRIAAQTGINLLWLDLGIVLFTPLTTVILVLQTSLILVLAVLMSWQAFKRNDDWRAGCWLALIFIKPHLLIVPMVLFAFKRRWRAVAPIILIGMTLLLISLWQFGIDGVRAYLDLLSVRSGWQYNPDIRWMQMTTSLVGFLQVYLISASLNLPWLAQDLWFIASLIFVTVLLVVWRSEWDPQLLRFDLQYGLLFAVTVLTTLHAYAYELAMLTPPFTVAFCKLSKVNVDSKRLTRAMALSLLVIPLCYLIALLNIVLLPILLALWIGWLAKIIARNPPWMQQSIGSVG